MIPKKQRDEYRSREHDGIDNWLHGYQFTVSWHIYNKNKRKLNGNFRVSCNDYNIVM